MDNESPESKQPSFSEAMQQIHGIMSEVSVMGANDSEFESFRTILQNLQEGSITPSEAVAQAIAIKDAKMDYH